MTSALLTLDFLLDFDCRSFFRARTTDELTKFIRRELIRIAFLERNRRRCTLDDAFKLKVPCPSSVNLFVEFALLSDLLRVRYWKTYVAMGAFPCG